MRALSQVDVGCHCSTRYSAAQQCERAARLNQRRTARPSHRPSPHLPFALFATFVLFAFALPARAQLLNLDRGTPPQPGEGKALLTRSESIERETRGLQSELKRVQTDQERTTIAFRLATRRLIIALIDHAETIGEPASTHALAALHLSAALDDLDDLASHASGADEPATHLRLALARFAQEIGDDPSIPADPGALDAYLRDRFAMLVQFQTERTPRAPWCADPLRCGWLATTLPAQQPQPNNLAPLIERLDERPDVTAATIDQLTTFNDLLTTADRWWIHRRTARALRRSLTDAAAILDPQPDWVPEPGHTRLIHHFTTAAADFTDKSRRPAAQSTLHDLARLAAILQSAAALTPPRSHAQAMHDALLSLAEAVTATATTPTATAGRLRNAETVVALLSERAALGDEHGVARELRPGWRVLTDDAERTQDALYAAFPRLAAAPHAMTDPALAGIVSAHRRSLDDLLALQTISRWLGVWLNQPATDSPYIPTAPGGPPTNSQDGRSARRLAAARVLDLCQSVARKNEKATALAELRTFAANLHDLAELPIEEQLRARRADLLNHLTGDRAADLARHIEVTRDRWLFTWATTGSGRDTGEDPAAIAAHLRALETLTTAIADAATLLNLQAAAGAGGPVPRREARPGVLAHAGIGLSKQAVVRLAEDVRTPLPALTAAAIAGDADAPTRLQRHAANHAVHALIAHLHRACADRDAVFCPRHILAATPRPDSPEIWLGNHDQDLAAISRYLEEYTHATAEGETTFARDLLAYLNLRASDLLPEFDRIAE